MAAYADARSAANSVLPLATDAPLYDKIRRRTREDGVEAIGSIKDYTLVPAHASEDEGKRQLLLGMKKRGFGVGKWNGFGGKFDARDRSRLRAAGIGGGERPRARADERRAQLLFTFRDSGKLMRVHVFAAEGFAGEPVETAEMAPRCSTSTPSPTPRCGTTTRLGCRASWRASASGPVRLRAGGDATNRVPR